MKVNFLSVVAMLTLLGMASQPLLAQRNCGSVDYLEHQLETDPKRAIKMRDIEEHTRHFEHNHGRAVNGVVTIPVVVHVVYNTAAENISDAQVLSQIAVLNADFRRTNSDADGTWSQAADSEIEFCMATVDPNGNPTNGITRTSTTVTAFGTNDNMKRNSTGGKDAWPTGQYLNIWVCDISGGILGYAQFPGGSAATDGVVIDYQYYGTTGTATAPFNLGRTATHEVGHWLNLRHIWGDGGCSVDDGVTDTPTSDAANYGCAVGHVSCSTVDMVQNYMDYSDDACMNLFTAGQKTRMRALFDTGGFRASLLTSGGCGSAPTPTCTDGIQNGGETGVDCGGPNCPACPPCTNVTVSITFDNYPEETSWNITNASGSVVASGGTYGSQADGSTLNIVNCLPDGCYTFTIFDAYGDGICCSYGNGSYTVTNASGTVVASGSSFTSSQATNFCIGGGPAPTCTDGIQNGSETGVDCGGPSCPACPTCDDGIQNGDETGVDCGGSCSPCETGCTQVVNNTANFESNFGIWTDGGTDCARVNSTTYANSGSYSVRLRDNTTTSLMSTTNRPFANFSEVTVAFSFITVSMENGEDFWLQVSTNGGSTYQTVKTWVAGTDFTNNSRQNVSVTLVGTFTNTTRIRFRNDASADDDAVYIDDVVISGCQNATRQGQPEGIVVVEEEASLGNLNVFPNPASDVLNVDFSFNSPMQQAQVDVFVTDLAGKVIMQQAWMSEQGEQTRKIDLSGYQPGIYLLHIVSGDSRETRKFAVIK